MFKLPDEIFWLPSLPLFYFLLEGWELLTFKTYEYSSRAFSIEETWVFIPRAFNILRSFLIRSMPTCGLLFGSVFIYFLASLMIFLIC